MQRRAAKAQLGFDLPRFDAVTAQFDLFVEPAQVFIVAIAQQPRAVAAVVQAQGDASHAVFAEYRRAALRLVQVTARQTEAGQAQFARHADRAGLSAEADRLQGRQRALGQGREQGRGADHMAAGAALELLQQALIRVTPDQARTLGQRQQRAHIAGIEGQRHAVEHARLAA
ncbi:hypothetical protein D3C85_688200 [compost metagenome]